MTPPDDLAAVAKTLHQQVLHCRHDCVGCPELLREALVAQRALGRQEREEPWTRPAPKCFKCGEQMTWREHVEMVNDEKPDIRVTMSHALVCQCGYQTINGSQFGEFQSRALAGEVARLRDGMSRLTMKLRAVHANEQYQSFCAMGWMHSPPYTGPHYAAELDAAEALLDGSAGQTTTGEKS